MGNALDLFRRQQLDRHSQLGQQLLGGLRQSCGVDLDRSAGEGRDGFGRGCALSRKQGCFRARDASSADSGSIRQRTWAGVWLRARTQEAPEDGSGPFQFAFLEVAKLVLEGARQGRILEGRLGRDDDRLTLADRLVFVARGG